jgi:hypothetical protein
MNLPRSPIKNIAQPDLGEPALLDAELLGSRFPADGGPFSLEDIREAADRMHHEIGVASLKAQLKANELATIELFCQLAQNSPELLPASWTPVYDRLVLNQDFWVYPSCDAVNNDDSETFAPYLNRAKLTSEWRDLLDGVHRPASAYRSSRPTECA